MTDSDDPLHPLAGTVRQSLHGFLEAYEPLRPELYRYCRYLTRSAWDAEDLAQDALARAFVTLGHMGEAPRNPRAWLFRVASNLWIDHTRRARPPGELPELQAAAPEPPVTREAAGALLTRLGPQERAAVVLKDVFEFSLEEVAEALSTSVGAVKAALHRGRGKLAEPALEEMRMPASAGPVLDAFCDAFNARDVERLTALLLDTASIEVVGVTTEYGKRGNIMHGMLFGSERLAAADTRGGIEARFMQGVLPVPPRCELRRHRGEALLLLWYRHTDGEAVRAINRVDIHGQHIARLHNYFFTPDFLAELCAELQVPFRSNGYRYWLSGC